MRTHNVFYFKQRINKDLFEEDVRRINCKLYFSISPDHIRKSEQLPFTLFCLATCMLFIAKKKEQCELKYFYYVTYILFFSLLYNIDQIPQMDHSTQGSRILFFIFRFYLIHVYQNDKRCFHCSEGRK